MPWQGLKAPTNKQKYEKIGEKKRTTPVYDLCSGLPRQFAQYLETVRNLGFDSDPDYEGYRRLLLSALDDINETVDGQYDWMKLNGEEVGMPPSTKSLICTVMVIRTLLENVKGIIVIASNASLDNNNRLLLQEGAAHYLVVTIGRSQRFLTTSSDLRKTIQHRNNNNSVGTSSINSQRFRKLSY